MNSYELIAIRNAINKSLPRLHRRCDTRHRKGVRLLPQPPALNLRLRAGEDVKGAGVQRARDDTVAGAGFF